MRQPPQRLESRCAVHCATVANATCKAMLSTQPGLCHKASVDATPRGEEIEFTGACGGRFQ